MFRLIQDMDNHKGRFNMSTKFLSIAVVFLLSSSMSHAALIVDQDGNIDNLEVNGQLYDVDWNFGQNIPVAADFSVFFNDAPLAEAFIEAVYAAFIFSPFQGDVFHTLFGFSYSDTNLLIIERETFNDGSFSGWSRSPGTYPLSVWGVRSDSGWGSVSLASAPPGDPSLSEVPEPSSLAIFALGIIGLVSRRFKKKS
jgi:hypothetical protein